MSYPILSNAFKQSVVGTYSNTDTVIELASISDTVGNADFLPDPASGEYNVILYDTLFGNPADANNGGSYEIMRVTSINYGDNEITVTRGQENSSAVTITDRPFAVLYGATSKFFTDLLSDVDGKEDADPTILKEADVIDNLTSTDTDKPLSANQGKVLEDGKEPADATILKQADIVDNLTSTSTTAPLSANQGKVLLGLSITDIDSWYVSTSFSGEASPISSNWVRRSTNFTKKGDGMSQSSGIFTFPKTGIWLINGDMIAELTGTATSRFTTLQIQISTNGGSSFFNIARGDGNLPGISGSTGTRASNPATATVNVTNTEDIKIRFRVNPANSSTEWQGGEDQNRFDFLRIGDNP
jgi:hypothetical protein